ncbi:6-hydroxymethyl-7,8-dihydropterin pyrophosphokinase [Halalkalicoccus paucihalophilus]|uniref:6-hydroxymethyl-7,8-dihydropterin pyrophosphokinase n=1 Tax=Halalkalicoccus paucihalophilus TaxID=1008153 RepID=A0A151AI00_9EURY|nr:6-hydroxymethylpterin diphosphokinase MptE-like protein [Halalkalicoccus paucihalophilus]KYH27289.1 6-hydroxymethyl-7,8-dihydropterin pyrophosphokinase [Halalkalicoccus paucihalophilus]
MNFETWEPVYEAILADFGFGRRADEHARDVLARLVKPFEKCRLAEIEGAAVAVAGAGPSLPDDLELAAGADYVIAASTAADVLREAGIDVDLMVTDLDKNPETVRRLTRDGVPVAVHAHGDNLALVERWVPRLADENVLPTTQAAPTGPVENFGGFTDGDRGAFLVDEFGASELLFPGWDFEDPSVGPTKARKLRWAERLLYWLETRRGERFAVLDGRRDGIDPVA